MISLQLGLKSVDLIKKMASILIASSDPESAAQIEERAGKLEIRTQIVSTTAAAKEWLGMQKYEMLIIDSGFKQQSSLNLAASAWEQDPYTAVALFGKEKEVPGEWQARALGVRIFSGPTAIDELELSLSLLSKSKRQQ